MQSAYRHISSRSEIAIFSWVEAPGEVELRLHRCFDRSSSREPRPADASSRAYCTIYFEDGCTRSTVLTGVSRLDRASINEGHRIEGPVTPIVASRRNDLP